MATMTYYVALAFTRSEDGEIVACEPKEARSSDQAIRMAGTMAAMEGHCGAIAFSRTGDPALGDFEDAVILKTVGEVDAGLLRRLAFHLGLFEVDRLALGDAENDFREEGLSNDRRVKDALSLRLIVRCNGFWPCVVPPTCLGVITSHRRQSLPIWYS